MKWYLIFLPLVFQACATAFVPAFSPSDPNWRQGPVRILLAQGEEEETIRSSGQIEVLDANDLLLKKTSDSVSIQTFSLKAPIRILGIGGPLEYRGTKYRGEIQIKPENGKVLIINVLPIEEYLYGVVPSEVPASWPEEALKAQAVCARTYAVRSMYQNRSKSFDVEATTNSQVYRGMSKEDLRSTRAIQETSGLVMVYDGLPIQSFFHSNSGGVTEDPKNVWGNSVEYLPSVRSDFDKIGENYSWEDRFTQDQMDSFLNNLGIGKIQDITVVNRFPSGRVDSMEALGTSGAKKIKATDFRRFLGATKIKSTRFGIRKEDDGSYFVRGLGYGHGVGLSQWGSYAMAKENYSFEDILNYYYKGISFARLTN